MVGGGHEELTLLLILANEQHIRRVLVAEAGKPGVLMPGGEVAVIAAKLVEVLVHAASAVVFEEEGPRPRAVGAFDLEHSVGDNGPGGVVVESFGGPVVGERELRAAASWRGMDRGFAVPFEEGPVEQLAVGEDPGVELEVVDDVAVVVQGAGLVAGRGFDVPGLLEEAVAGGAELVGPGVGAAPAVRAKALEVPGAKELGEAAADGLVAADPPSSLSPGVKRRKHPRRGGGLLRSWEKPIERNTWRET